MRRHFQRYSLHVLNPTTLVSLVLLASSGLLACIHPPAPQRFDPPEPLELMARGVVFEDLDGDGLRGDGEPGVPGVMVSNGVSVSQSDAHGKWKLTVNQESIVFVIKPRGWMTPVDENQLPRFFYIHKPQGSPDQDFLFPGVEPTGPLPPSIDFPLVRHPEPDQFDILVVADPQPANADELAWYARSTIAPLLGTDAVMGFSLGDLVYDDLDLFNGLNQVQSLLGIPWYNVIGNHDINYMAYHDVYSDESYERVYGPSTYALNYGPVHFIVLDVVHWEGFAGYNRRGQPKRGAYR